MLTEDMIVRIDLSYVDRVKQFVRLAQDSPCEVSVRSGKFVVDGKSILGVFSLDLTSPVEVITDDVELLDTIKKFAE